MISWTTILVEIKSRMACQLKGDLVLPDDPELKKGFKVSYIEKKLNREKHIGSS